MNSLSKTIIMFFMILTGIVSLSCKNENVIFPQDPNPEVDEGVFVNPIDPRFAEMKGPNNQRIIYYGTKESDGTPIQVTHYEIINGNNQKNVAYIKNGKISSVKFFDDSFASFEYDSINNRVAINLKKDTMEVRFSIPYNPTLSFNSNFQGSRIGQISMNASPKVRIKVSSKNTASGEIGSIFDAFVEVKYTMDNGNVLSGYAVRDNGPIFPGDPAIYNSILPIADPNFHPNTILVNSIIESIQFSNTNLCASGLYEYVPAICPSLLLINPSAFVICESLAEILAAYCLNNKAWNLNEKLDSWKNSLTNAINVSVTENIQIEAYSYHPN
ncbi:MAG: hypothetical protein ABI528_10420, partial [bacterium]